MAIGGTGAAETRFGGPAGYGHILFERGDDASFVLDVSTLFRDGLVIFGRTYLAPVIYVNVNGTISIGGPVAGYPRAGMAPDHPVIAPFWADVDTSWDGESAQIGAIWADIDSENGVLTVTWADVGPYRHVTEVTNTFQVQIFDQGGGNFDIAFRYEQIEWATGSALDDLGAVAGVFDPNGSDLLLGGEDLMLLPDVEGNSGVSGLWVYSVENGVIRDYFSQIAPVYGSDTAETLTSGEADDHLLSQGGDDSVDGGAGADTIDAGQGDDFVFGGAGDDEIYGRDGDDDLTGGYGADRIAGEDGQDILTGSAHSDVVLGGNGDDFLNGGWGHDRLTGGVGADRFYHEGVEGHGSDWVTDYYAPEGDILVFGGSASKDDFLIQYAETPGVGQDGVSEAFVTFVPTGQILWAIEDGIADQINIWVEGDVFEF